MLPGFLKNILPPIVHRGICRLVGSEKKDATSKRLWHGDFETWDVATSQGTGYDHQFILTKVREASLRVKNGEVAYERDSVTFDKIHYSWPLLACLEHVAIEKHNKLHVTDFGGSLGSSYFQNRNFLSQVSDLRWTVVEQQHFVECGRKEFETSQLQFETSVEESLKKNEAHCLLLSGVLQYLEDPLAWIDKFSGYNFDYIILDRTGFTTAGRDLLTIQNVPPNIYAASYPCWFFDEREFMERFTSKYLTITDFEVTSTPPIKLNGSKCHWKGFFLKKIKNG